jgi:fermentation-respiration switch protein FrsA (DUF1100 family)
MLTLRALLLLSLPASVFAATTVLFDPSTPRTGPFPTDFLTVRDAMQKTGVRINLPVPPCTTQYTSCQETGLLEQFDGFSIRARAQARFSAAVSVNTLRSGMFYIALNNLTSDEPGIHKNGEIIPVDQVVYDPTTNTVYAKPQSALDQHRRYAFVVTSSVQDAAGNPVAADPAYSACLRSQDAYCAALAQVVGSLPTLPNAVIAATIFTTMSATAWMEHARDSLQETAPRPALLQGGSFLFSNLAGVVLHEQTGSNPLQFTDLSLPLTNTLLAGLGAVVMGSYESPNFLEADQTIRPVPSGPGLSAPYQMNQVYFNALLPASPKPAPGYPVVIFGHGFGDSRFGGPTAVAPTMARAGFAVIAINAVGHGFGPLSTVSFVDIHGNTTTLPAGGRGIDMNGDGQIDPEEGCTLVSPIAYGTRDCFRQTVVDLLQLVRAIRAGIDLDGDGKPDLDASRIYYGGQSLGAMYGTMLMALDPSIRAAALNVGGATEVDIARWSPSYADLTTQSLAEHMPSLLNAGDGFNQDYVLPNQPAHVATVPGAIAIQNELETLEWLAMYGDPMAFAPHLKISPLAGVTARPVLMQFARGDMTVPNPANSGLIQAAGLEANTWEYRHDLARAQAPYLPANPHAFLVFFINLSGSTIQLPGLSGLAIGADAQGQVASFFASDGAAIPDPNVLSALLLGVKVFQQPAALPWDLGF